MSAEPFNNCKMAKDQANRNAQVKCNKKLAEGANKDQHILFEKMLKDLYHESAAIRRSSDISHRILSMRFGSDY